MRGSLKIDSNQRYKVTQLNRKSNTSLHKIKQPSSIVMETTDDKDERYNYSRGDSSEEPSSSPENPPTIPSTILLLKYLTLNELFNLSVGNQKQYKHWMRISKYMFNKKRKTTSFNYINIRDLIKNMSHWNKSNNLNSYNKKTNYSNSKSSSNSIASITTNRLSYEEDNEEKDFEKDEDLDNSHDYHNYNNNNIHDITSDDVETIDHLISMNSSDSISDKKKEDDENIHKKKSPSTSITKSNDKNSATFICIYKIFHLLQTLRNQSSDSGEGGFLTIIDDISYEMFIRIAYKEKWANRTKQNYFFKPCKKCNEIILVNTMNDNSSGNSGSGHPSIYLDCKNNFKCEHYSYSPYHNHCYNHQDERFRKLFRCRLYITSYDIFFSIQQIEHQLIIFNNHDLSNDSENSTSSGDMIYSIHQYAQQEQSSRIPHHPIIEWESNQELEFQKRSSTEKSCLDD